MEKQTKQGRKQTSLLETGFSLEYAFIKSLSQSKTLQVMVVIGIVLFGALGLFLYKMAGA